MESVDGRDDANNGEKRLVDLEEGMPTAFGVKEGGGGGGGGAGDDETNSLLPSKFAGGMADKKRRKPRQKVQWNDRMGNKLVEILEFQPSESSEDEDDDADYCFCSMM